MFRQALLITSTSAMLSLASCATPPSSDMPDIRIVDTEVYPESLDSTSDGTIFVGSVKGIIYRALPGASFARPWIRHSPENGILTLLGVRVQEETNTLWTCSAPNFFGPERSQGVSSLIAFALDSGDFKARYPFPPPASVCNDISFDDDGTVYVTDTSNGRLFTLPSGASDLQLYAEDDSLVGVDGIEFSEDGLLYVNNVRTNQMLRVDRGIDGSFQGLTQLNLSLPLDGPDGLRLIRDSHFVQAEGNSGRVAVVTIDGDDAEITVISDDFESTPGVTVVNNTAYVIESNIRYLLGPVFDGDRRVGFMIYAVPLPALPERDLED